MTEQLVPCKRCKCIPKIVEVSGLFYVQCDGQQEKVFNTKDSKGNITGKTTTTTKCDKWQSYEFLGATRRAAIASWNYANTHKTLETED